MKKTNLLTFLLIIAGCTTVIGLLILNTGIKSFAFTSVAKRTIIPYAFSLNKQKVIEGSVLYEIKNNGKNYFVRDGKNNCLYRFDKNLNLEKITLKSTAKDISIREFRPFSKCIAMFDYKNHTIFITDSTGRIVSKYVTDVNRPAFLDTNQFIINFSKKSDLDAAIMDFAYDNKLKKRAIRVTPQIPNSLLSYAGFFVEDAKNVYYITYYYNNMYYIGDSGQQIAQYKTVEKTIPLPEIKDNGNGYKIYGPKSVLINASAAVDEKYLYVISRYEKGNNHWVIDCYDKEKCIYKYSFEPPSELKNEILQGIFVNGNTVYFSTIDKVYSFTANHY